MTIRLITLWMVMSVLHGSLTQSSMVCTNTLAQALECERMQDMKGVCTVMSDPGMPLCALRR